MKPIFTLAIGFFFGGLTVWMWLQEDSSVAEKAVEMQSTASSLSSHTVQQSDSQPASFKDLQQLRSDFEQTLALYRLMEGKDTQGLLQLLDEAKDHLRGGDFSAAASILYARLAELDPMLALSRVLEQPNTAQSSWLHSIFHSWARIDLDAAMLAAHRLNNPFKQIAGRAILRSRGDLSSAKQSQITSDLAIQSPPVSSSTDFSQVWQEALAQPNPNQQAQRLMQLATMWAASDPTAAILASSAIRSAGLRGAIQGQIAAHWVTQDPQAALDWVLQQKRSPNQAQMIKQAFQALASQDVLSAQERANQLTGRQRNQAMLGVLGPLAVSDPQAATRWLEEQNAPEFRMQAIQSIAMVISQTSPAQADQWLATLPPNDAQMAETILSAMTVHVDPNQAALRVETMVDPRRRRRAAKSLVNNWAQQDVDATAAWIQKMPSDERSPLYQSLIERWGQWDPDEARGFIERLQNAEHRDHASLGLLGSTTSFDDARQLYNGITDENLKKQASRRLYYKFRLSHPEDVEAYRWAEGIPNSP